MALSMTSQKKKPAPRKNPEGLIDEGLIRDVGPAIGVGFAHAYLENNLAKFDWWHKMSTGKRLLLLAVGGVYFRRQGKASLSFALFALAGTYVQKYLAERQKPQFNGAGAGAGAGAAGAGAAAPDPAKGNTMVQQEMLEVTAGLGSITNYEGPGFDPSSLMGPGSDNFEFAIG